jgi:hypothetical protein
MQASRRKAHRVTGPFDRCRLGLIDTPIGQRISLRLTLPYEGTVTVHAETVYGRPGFGFAVRFVDLTDESRACLRSALDKLRQNVA